MSDHDIDWNRIRGVPWDDDALDRGELVAEIDQLRRELRSVTQRTTDERGAETSSLLHAEMRRLTAEVSAMKASLPPLLVPMDTAAELLNVSLSTVRRMIKAGDLPYRKLGRSIRVDLTRCRGLDGEAVAQLARAARSGR